MTKKKGFTLVELLVVIAILAILATVSIVGYTSFISKANNSNAMTELKQASDIVYADLIGVIGKQDGQDTIAVYSTGDSSNKKVTTFEYGSDGLVTFATTTSTDIGAAQTLNAATWYRGGKEVSDKVYYSDENKTLAIDSYVATEAKDLYYIASEEFESGDIFTGSKNGEVTYYSDDDCSTPVGDQTLTKTETFYYFAKVNVAQGTKFADGRIILDNTTEYYKDKTCETKVGATTAEKIDASGKVFTKVTYSDFNTAFKAKFTDVAELKGAFTLNSDGSITYTTENGKGTCTWKSGEQVGK